MKRTRRHIFVLVTMLAILSLVLAACGDDEDDADTNGDVPVSTPTTAAGTDDTGDDDDAEATEGDDDADDGGTDDGDAEAGQAIYQEQCASCHTIDGSEAIGPTWQGIWMHEVTLEDGSTVLIDEAYIAESIQEPNAKVVEGFSGIMPDLDLDDDQIEDVIAFIKTLE